METEREGLIEEAFGRGLREQLEPVELGGIDRPFGEGGMGREGRSARHGAVGRLGDGGTWSC